MRAGLLRKVGLFARSAAYLGHWLMHLSKIFAAAIALAAFTDAARAADLPDVKAPPPFTPPVLHWDGLYAGGQIGYAWGDVGAWSTTPAGLTTGIGSYGPSGVIGGAHIGYNWQWVQYIVGLEGDVDGSSFARTVAFPAIATGTSIPVEGTVRARLGYAFDQMLVYATGGLVVASIDDTYAAGAGYSSIDMARLGWTAGAGLEYAVTPVWSVRAEYRYAGFGHYNDFPAFGALSYNKRVDEQVAQIGFSYRFDTLSLPPPVVAKY